ncbi:hypothetical protein B0T20DRAFT_149224 [Sordaria brevicollis]|uniref:Secreted protein n=1 Tax=Sordaria brevicollis TaxID=83679 RepID=A0AAE0UDW5_SORBR|nr:hypothetical protein B0T20DRAFT_149224 [Sordaria brevicollis]
MSLGFFFFLSLPLGFTAPNHQISSKIMTELNCPLHTNHQNEKQARIFAVLHCLTFQATFYHMLSFFPFPRACWLRGGLSGARNRDFDDSGTRLDLKLTLCSL